MFWLCSLDGGNFFFGKYFRESDRQEYHKELVKILLQLIWIPHCAKVNTRAMFLLHGDYFDLCHFRWQMDKCPTYIQVYWSHDVANIHNWHVCQMYQSWEQYLGK